MLFLNNWRSHFTNIALRAANYGPAKLQIALMKLFAIIAITIAFSSAAAAQVSAPPNINGTFATGQNNLAGTATGSNTAATLTGLGEQNGVTFDFDASLIGTARWNGGLRFNTTSELQVQADSTTNAANSASYIYRFSQTVYGLQFEVDGLDNADEFIISFFKDGAAVPVVTSTIVNGSITNAVPNSVVTDAGTNVDVTPAPGGTIIIDGDNNDNAEEFIRVELPLNIAVDEVRFAPTNKNNSNAQNVTLQHRAHAWATPDVAITKGSSINSAAAGSAVGDIITYTFEVTNTGQVPLTNVVVSETTFTGSASPPAITFVSGTNGSSPANFSQGDVLTYTASYPITAADIAAGFIDNQASVVALPVGGVVGVSELTDLSDSSNPADGAPVGDFDGDDPTRTPIAAAAPAPALDISKPAPANADEDGSLTVSVGDLSLIHISEPTRPY